MSPASKWAVGYFPLCLAGVFCIRKWLFDRLAFHGQRITVSPYHRELVASKGQTYFEDRQSIVL